MSNWREHFVRNPDSIAAEKAVAIASLTWEVDTDRYETVDAIFDETDYEWRRIMNLTQLAKSGEPLPEDYFTRVWDVYNSPL